MDWKGLFRPKDKKGAIPMLNQVMSATSGATHAFSGVSGHVNSSPRKLGAKNIQAGIGCGVGFGHGFGVGLAVKPGVIHQIQSSLTQAVMKMVTKFGISSKLPFDQLLITQPLQGGTDPSNLNSINTMQLAAKTPVYSSRALTREETTDAISSNENISSKKPLKSVSYGNRTVKVINNFMQSPVMKDKDNLSNESGGHLRSETDILFIVISLPIIPVFYQYMQKDHMRF